MLETARIFYHSTQRNIPEDGHFQFTTTSEWVFFFAKRTRELSHCIL
jgi:hypothetical protein